MTFPGQLQKMIEQRDYVPFKRAKTLMYNSIMVK